MQSPITINRDLNVWLVTTACDARVQNHSLSNGDLALYAKSHCHASRLAESLWTGSERTALLRPFRGLSAWSIASGDVNNMSFLLTIN